MRCPFVLLGKKGLERLYYTHTHASNIVLPRKLIVHDLFEQTMGIIKGRREAIIIGNLLQRLLIEIQVF